LVINITMSPTGLFNRTNSRFDGIGGDAIPLGQGPAKDGGNGGILQINYHGLLGATWNVNVSGGTGDNDNGADGSIVQNKYLAPCPRDADVDDSGTIVLADVFVIADRYNNISTDFGFNDYHDINCDEKLNVIELSRIGFDFGRGSD